MPPDLSHYRILLNDEPESGLNLLQKGLQCELMALGVRGIHAQPTDLHRKLGRAMGKFGLVRPLLQREPTCIVPLTWASEAPLFPRAYTHRILPWIFDCWGPQFPAWEKLLRKYRISRACFSSRDAAGYFARVIPELKTHWIPEACDPARFDPTKPLAQRTLHVLEIGRKHPSVHEAITKPLAQASKRHMYSSGGSEKPIYPTLDSLYQAFSDSIISVCFPKSITHPQGSKWAAHPSCPAGTAETLTQRYFETIGSGALAVGTCPRELSDMFGFNPVIELSLTDPAGHMLEILKDPGAYQSHADTCRQRLMETCTFAQRARMLIDVLDDESR